jgi:hypothetical protein
MKRHIVQEPELSGTEIRPEHVLDKHLKHVTSDRPVNFQSPENALHRQGPHEAEARPLAARFLGDRSVSTGGIARGPTHSSQRPHLIDGNTVLCLKRLQLFLKGLASRVDVFPFLFGGAFRLFFRVIRARCKVRQMVGCLTNVPVCTANWARSSSWDASLCVLMNAANTVTPTSSIAG